MTAEEKKACHAAASKKYRDSHREWYLAYAKAYRKSHRKQILEYVRKYRAGHLRQIADYAKKYRAEHPEKSRVYVKRWATNNPEKVHAQKQLQQALQNGTVIRPRECSSCGKIIRINGHHRDYSRPLDATWLCHRCHKKLDLVAMEVGS